MEPLRAFCVAAMVTLAATATVELPQSVVDAIINSINTNQDTWKAGRNFPTDITRDQIKMLIGTIKDDYISNLTKVEYSADVIDNLPENFDPRDKWPDCPTLNEISDQGSCGSCWAVAAAGAMTDRYCTYSNGTKHFHFSSQDLISCCAVCGGCNGGVPTLAWEYWKHYGLVSGGNYNSSQGCLPYQIPPCEYHVPGNSLPCSEDAKTPKCVTTCQDGYKVQYEKDKRYGKQVFSVARGEENLRAELFQNGPVEGTFTVYEDLLYYKSGVYKHTEGNSLGLHSIKILGWGVENGNKYWLIANTWGKDWGNKGFFKMLRGEDHCGIEKSIIAGEPLL